MVVTQKKTPEVTSDRIVTWEGLLRSMHTDSENIQFQFPTHLFPILDMSRTTTMEIQTPTIKQLAKKAIKSNITIQTALTTKVTELETQLKELDEFIVSHSLSRFHTRPNSSAGLSKQRSDNGRSP